MKIFQRYVVLDRIAGIETHGTIDCDSKLGLSSIATLSRLLLLFAWGLLACTDNQPGDVPATNSARLPPSDASMAVPIVDTGLDDIGDATTSDAAVAESIIDERRDYAVGDVQTQTDASPLGDASLALDSEFGEPDSEWVDAQRADVETTPSETEPFEGFFNERIGFGAGATGGQGGAVCLVATLEDSGEGSLRNCLEQVSQPTWVRFEVDGDIHLQSPITVPSNVTVDGRDRYVRIYDEGFHIHGVSNVIITNLIFKEGNDDAIQLKHAARNIWIHHVSLSNYTDGLIDITRGATDVTISWCKFSMHRKVMLIGADPDHTSDSDIRVTLHHNWFRETNSRHPRLRFGKVHAFNNLYDEWGSYAIGCSQLGECYSEANIFEAGGNTSAILRRVGEDEHNGKVISVNDRRVNDAEISTGGTVFTPSDFYGYQAESASADLADRLREDAGWQ